MKEYLPYVASREAVIAWARDRLQNPDTLYLDTETTGLGRTAEIVEVAVLDQEGRALIDTLVRPQIWIPSEATALHGISNRMVLDASAWSDVHAALRELLAGATVVTYNARFDERLVRQTSARHGLGPLACRWDCAMERCASYLEDWDETRGRWHWASLGTAAERLAILGEEIVEHRASVDAELCRRVVHAMAGR